MKKIICANWKAHLSREYVDSWLEVFTREYAPVQDLRVVLAVPFLYMEHCRKTIDSLPQVSLAAQGVSPYPQGNYTGATPASWLHGLASYVIVGQRERRHYFHETVQEVAGQVRETVDAGLNPIICMDDDILTRQLAALDMSDMRKSLFAYTPEDADRLEVARDGEKIREVAARLANQSGSRPVLYGGGVNEENAGELLAMSEISGVMLGRSSLNAEKFAGIIRQSRKL